MPVTIDQIDVDVATAPTTANDASSPSRENTKLDSREIQRQIELQATRRARIRAD